MNFSLDEVVKNTVQYKSLIYNSIIEKYKTKTQKLSQFSF